MKGSTSGSGGGLESARMTPSSSLKVVLYFMCLVKLLSGLCHTLEDKEEKFSEDLLIRPLSDGKILSHFYFKNYLQNLGTASHHHVFPKAISQVVRKFHITELELSFTQGRWNYERWGAVDPIASSNAKPSGVELWAEFNVPLDQIDATWRNLTHALSGLFCASVNFLESPAMIAAPNLAFGSTESATSNRKNSGLVRYGALPREAVCTENLTPWLKLLPCRDKAGLSTLLDRPSVYKGHYHSLRVHVWRSGPSRAVVLEQTLTLVSQPAQAPNKASKDLPHWSLISIFGRKLEGSCPLSDSSRVLLELERPLVENVEALVSISGEAKGDGDKSRQVLGRDKTGQVDVADNPAFHVSPYPDKVFVESEGSEGVSSLILEYNLQKHSVTRPLNLGMLWKERVFWSSLRGPFRVSRFLVGSGNQKGSIAIELKRNHDFSSQAGKETAGGEVVEVTIFQMVTWYVRLYLHTLTARVDGNVVPLRDITTQMLVTPAEDRLSPAVLEIQLTLPGNVSMLSVNMDFDKGFLHIDEHPPDANRGFDLPSALLSFPRSQTARQYSSPQPIDDKERPLLKTLQNPGSVHVYTDNLLVPLATPDFSMPYNVITFTCTVLALYFGSLLNTLRRRIGEEERLAKAGSGGKLKKLIAKFMEGKSNSEKKIIKVAGAILIAVIAIAGNYALEYYEVF